MIRALLCTLFALCLLAAPALAKEYKGQAVKLEIDKNVLVVKVGDKEETIKLTDKTSFVNAKGKTIDKEKLEKMTKAIGKGRAEFTVDTEGESTKEVATKVTITVKKKAK